MKKYRLNQKYRPDQKGFTLAEAMMAMVVLAIAAAGIIMPFSSAAAVQSESTIQTLGAKLAADMLEEIITTDFDQLISAYDGYSESAGSVQDADGGVFSDPTYNNFSLTVACEHFYALPQAGIVSPNFVKITVQAYYDGRQIAELTRLKSE